MHQKQHRNHVSAASLCWSHLPSHSGPPFYIHTQQQLMLHFLPFLCPHLHPASLLSTAHVQQVFPKRCMKKCELYLPWEKTVQYPSNVCQGIILSQFLHMPVHSFMFCMMGAPLNPSLHRLQGVSEESYSSQRQSSSSRTWSHTVWWCSHTTSGPGDPVCSVVPRSLLALTSLTHLCTSLPALSQAHLSNKNDGSIWL